MYERNAILLERYFNEMFGYNMKNNIKTNFKDYCELVEILEKYKEVSDEEETIIQEYDSIANKIREIQRKQDSLNKKNNSYQAERASIFQNIDDNSKAIQKKVDNVNNNIQNINKEIEENAKNYIEVVNAFNEKSIIRTDCGKRRREIENKYNKKLNETLDNYKNINIDIEKKAKQFIDTDTTKIEEELKEKMKKNGEKEKIPFNEDIVIKAIALCVDIQKRETDILANIYEKTNKLFADIKNNTIKNDKHKKAIRDSKSKLEFIEAIKEYLIQFLDNERLTAVNGEEEHKRLMEEACKNIEEDLVQINNLYSLLLKEISKKITKKSYADLYNLEYLEMLEEKSQEFESEVKKLNLSVTILNPNYWRIEGMKRIYEVFYHCVTDNYGRDLSMYFPTEDMDEEEQDIGEEKSKKTRKTTRSSNKQEGDRAEIDKKIDIILGLDEDKKEKQDDSNNDEESEEDWDDDFEEEKKDIDSEDNLEENKKNKEKTEDELLDSYIWGNEENDDEDDEEDWDDDDFDDEEDDNDDFDDKDDDELEDDDFEDDEDEEEKEDDDEDDYDLDEKIFDDEDDESNLAPGIKNLRNARKQTYNADWGNEFININDKNEEKKKKGFFDKFKK